MLNWLFMGIGAVTRDIVEGADSTYETAKEVIVDTASEVASIPEMLAEGYSEGFISNGDHPKGDKGFVDPKDPAPAAPTPTPAPDVKVAA